MLYVFEDYTLDTRRDELCRAGALVPLDYQVFQVLAYLLAHPDRGIPRRDLCEQLWPTGLPAIPPMALVSLTRPPALVGLPWVGGSRNSSPCWPSS